MNKSRLVNAFCAGVFTLGMVSSAHADTIEYVLLGGGWTYEEDVEDTLELRDNPTGGVTATLTVPSGIEDGGLTASRHSVPGFSLIDGAFIELEYSSLSSTIDGDAASLDLNLELEFYDSGSNIHEIAMDISQVGGRLGFESWFDEEFVVAPVPNEIATNQGALGLYVTDTTVMPYFKDAEGNLTFPFAGWDVSQIIGAHNFSVDNDFEASTLDGGSVLASVNLDRVVYGVGSPVPDIRGKYSGTYSIDVWGCSDSTMDGTYHGTMEIDIPTLIDDVFSGTAIGTLTIDDDTGVENINLSGTVGPTGNISGTTSHTFFNTAGTGTFTGQLNQDTLTIENTGQDTVGDICSYTRHITAARSGANPQSPNMSWLPLLLE